jgi:hypothetical protein
MRPFYHEGQLEVEGETLHLVCNFRALDVIESVTGEKMSAILPQLMDPPHALVGKVLWGLLREKHEGITLDEAAGVAFGPSGDAAGLVMGDVFRRAFNIGEQKENPPKRRGTSRSSAKSG